MVINKFNEIVRFLFFVVIGIFFSILIPDNYLQIVDHFEIVIRVVGTLGIFIAFLAFQRPQSFNSISGRTTLFLGLLAGLLYGVVFGSSIQDFISLINADGLVESLLCRGANCIDMVWLHIFGAAFCITALLSIAIILKKLRTKSTLILIFSVITVTSILNILLIIPISKNIIGLR